MASDESAVLFDQPGPKTRKTIRIVNWIAGIVFAIVVVLILMRLHNPPDGENQLSWELWKPALDAEAWTDFYLPGLWATIRASVLAVIGAVLFGLIFGIYSATHSGSVGDYILTVLAFIGVAVPSFFLALGSVYVFSLKLGWFPTGAMRTIGVELSSWRCRRRRALPAMRAPVCWMLSMRTSSAQRAPRA